MEEAASLWAFASSAIQGYFELNRRSTTEHGGELLQELPSLPVLTSGLPVINTATQAWANPFGQPEAGVDAPAGAAVRMIGVLWSTYYPGTYLAYHIV